MGYGDHGQRGILAVQPAEVEIRPGPENVTTQLQPMKVLTALIQKHHRKPAIPKLVLLVRTV